MRNLQSLLDDPKSRSALTQDCVEVVRNRMQEAAGLSGRVLRTGYKMAEQSMPGLVQRATEYLLPDFLRAVDPFYQRSRDSGEPFGEYVCANSGEIAELLLSVTDTRVQSQSRVLRSAYSKLRRQARGHVEAALPDMAARLDEYLPV